MFEAKCPKCGKNLIVAPFHIYRDDRGFYCSWTCFHHKDDDTPPKKRKVKIIEQCTNTGSVIKTFRSAKQAAEYIDGSINSIRVACIKHSLYRGYLWRYKNDLS